MYILHISQKDQPPVTLICIIIYEIYSTCFWIIFKYHVSHQIHHFINGLYLFMKIYATVINQLFGFVMSFWPQLHCTKPEQICKILKCFFFPCWNIFCRQKCKIYFFQKCKIFFFSYILILIFKYFQWQQTELGIQLLKMLNKFI